MSKYFISASEESKLTIEALKGAFDLLYERRADFSKEPFIRQLEFCELVQLCEQFTLNNQAIENSIFRNSRGLPIFHIRYLGEFEIVYFPYEQRVYVGIGINEYLKQTDKITVLGFAVFKAERMGLRRPYISIA